MSDKKDFKLLKTPFTEDIIANRFHALIKDLYESEDDYTIQLLEIIIYKLNEQEDNHFLNKVQDKLEEAKNWYMDYLEDD